MGDDDDLNPMDEETGKIGEIKQTTSGQFTPAAAKWKGLTSAAGLSKLQTFREQAKKKNMASQISDEILTQLHKPKSQILDEVKENLGIVSFLNLDKTNTL